MLIRKNIKKLHFKYKGFKTTVYYNQENEVYRGKIENANSDLITFEADSISNAEKEFRKAIDDYIDMLKYFNKL